MGKKVKTAITPTREEDYSQWYQEVVKASDMSENSPVRGCMVIKPWGFAIWENIQRQMDAMFKETGVKNAYFPLFIPLSYLEKEAEHVDGFAKECAVVTHHKLEKGEDGRLVPAGELAEPLIVRPTSETIIGESMSRWTSSYRDLPILLNQWANVVRWEMRTRMFLRTSEFLWQEGHTAHATKDEAMERTLQMLEIYARFVEERLAMPVIKGRKSESERFPGADDTTCIEAMMQDKRALQAGTSHFLGQNFAKSSNIKFQNEAGQEDYAWTTSWGTSTRMIGGMIMVHSDDDGLVVPPRIAPAHVVILPIIKKGADNSGVLESAETLKVALRQQTYYGLPVEVEIDSRDIGGARGWEWVKKGIPVRVELGPRDIENNSVFMARRDTGEKKGLNRDEFINTIADILDDIQDTLFQRAHAFREANTVFIDEKDKFYDLYKNAKGYNNGAFVMAHWCGSGQCEEKIKQDLSVTIRCIPFDSPDEEGTCICCGAKSDRRVLFAKAY
ncbi:proline--tRNA ligase [Desulfobacter hydrogenophilus]|uniref:Proline--tRNA ligase n=1 Tax=Desulfobacter hydrogenophilus TaxID=2291 RepID=A0A328FKA5_9BACT|nr:proline--tRNA ligase [Desulfobacter hydrogenophilus]NDY70717.1 proline--tRNA ligase [Desulfobacter hydrogenophilus]QBH12670.1 proline--tRNA ligase [Desulfobacter hydrogenophilus]RAM03365.1 proline--tRNA ligase [Desulfobacter hydrogenophilus]